MAGTTKIADLPAMVGESTYEVKYVSLSIFLFFLGQCGAFFGIFFGVRGPDNQWPYAWWAFGLLGGAIGATAGFASGVVKTVQRKSDSFDFINAYGKVFLSTTLEQLEEIKVGSGKATFVLTDEALAEFKQQNKCCACCIGKSRCFAFSNLDKFASDHGLA